jgi:nucleoside-diphosphate kinase
MTDLEQTLVLLKPDAVRRGLVGTILARYEAKGLTPVAIELRQIDAAMADRHYSDHVNQPWYPPLREYIVSGPLVAMVLAGPSVIEVVRLMNGVTNSAAAAPGTIRGDFSLSNRENLVHASDSPDSAAKEIGLWFPNQG